MDCKEYRRKPLVRTHSFPFGDNVERARKSGVEYIVQPGGSIRDDNVIETANKYGITMAFHRYASVPSLMKLLKGYYAYF